MFKKIAYSLSVLFILSSGFQFLFSSSHASAVGGQVTSRKITLNNSSPSATSVTYAVSFIPTAGGSSTLGGIVVDFCANTPIVGDTSCTYPTAFTMGATPVFNTITGIGTGGTWVTTSSCQGGAAAGQTQVLKLTNATAQSVTGLGTTPITFNVTGVTNTSSNGAFYARIITFDTKSNADTNYTCSGTTRAATFTGQQDYGGVALSTAQNAIITSKVFETLSFCVYQTSCGTQAQLTLGDAVTGLSAANAYVNNNAKYTLATNAQSGVSVTIFGQTLCRAATLTFANCPTGANTSTISAIGGTAATRSVGTEQFGMCINAVSGTTAQAPYDDNGTGNNCTTGIATGTYSGTSKFGFDDTNTTGTNSAGGDVVLSSAGAVASASSQFAFLADISTTTEAAVYQANLNLVATGTF